MKQTRLRISLDPLDILARYTADNVSLRQVLTVPPEGTDLVLSSDVPDGERDVLVLDSLDVEACGVR
jgi:hypothetical protein